MNACKCFLRHFTPLLVSLRPLRLAPHLELDFQLLLRQLPVADPGLAEPLNCRHQQRLLSRQLGPGWPPLVIRQVPLRPAELFAAQQSQRPAASATVATSTEQHPAVAAGDARPWSAQASRCDGGIATAPAECPECHDRSHLFLSLGAHRLTSSPMNRQPALAQPPQG